MHHTKQEEAMKRMLAVLCILVAGCSSLPNRKAELSDVIRNYGFRELRPPSNLTPPGSIVYVRSATGNTIELGTTCPQLDAVGSAAVADVTTQQQELTKKTTGTFSIDADYLKQLTGGVELKSVKDVTLTLTNPHVLDIADSEVFKTICSRTGPCEQAIALRHSKMDELAMVKTALQADITYTVTWNQGANLTAEASEKLLKNIAAKLGAAFQTEGASTIKGSGLIWGIIEDADLVVTKPPCPPGFPLRALDPTHVPRRITPNKPIHVAE